MALHDFQSTISELCGEGTNEDNYMALMESVEANYGREVRTTLDHAIDATDGEFYLVTDFVLSMFNSYLLSLFMQTVTDDLCIECGCTPCNCPSTFGEDFE